MSKKNNKPCPALNNSPIMEGFFDFNLLEEIEENATSDKIIRTFTLHLNKKQDIKYLRRSIYDYKHMENMIILLIKYCKEDQEHHAAKLLLNNITMKALLKKTKGGKKTKHDINYLKNKLLKYPLFTTLLDYVDNKKINGHNISMIVRRMKNDFKNHEDRLKDGLKSTAPKAKSLNKIVQYSVPLESNKWTLKKDNHIGVNLHDKMYYIYFPHQGKLLKELQSINNITVSVSNDQVYLNIGYCKSLSKKEPSGKSILPKPVLEAGGDVGIINLLSLFLNDKNDNSLILSGKKYINYNCFYNKQISKINEDLAKNVIEYREIAQQDGGFIKIPTKYNQKGIQLKNKKKLLTEKRNRYFDEEFLQLAMGVVRYCKKYNITSLVLSNNLSFTKIDGSIKMDKKTKQKFYQIPFGRLLNKIKSIGQEYGINVLFKNEAYTSKSSCISVNVSEIQKIKNEDRSISTDFGGSRLKRGLFHDKKTDLKFNADINGAANHIIVAYPAVKYNYGKILKRKLCSPKKIKSKFNLLQVIKEPVYKVEGNDVDYDKIDQQDVSLTRF